MNEFSKRLTKKRIEGKYTQDSFAGTVGLSRARYANYEQGRREPDFETVKFFANKLNVTTDYLLGLDNEKKGDATMAEHIGIRVKKLRNQLGLSTRGLAEKSGVSAGYVSQLENVLEPRSGKPISPTVDTVTLLAKGLNTSIEYLLGLDKTKEKTSERIDETMIAQEIMDVLNKYDLSVAKTIKLLDDVRKDVWSSSVIYIALGERILELRNREMLTQSELSKRLGVSPSTIAMYERGERNPSPSMIVKISKFFGVTTDYLLGNVLEVHHDSMD